MVGKEKKMNENLKNKKIREQIKKRLLVEAKDPELPAHRKIEVESLLYEINCFEQHQGAV